MADETQVTTQVFRNVLRKSRPPSCALDRDDLVALFQELETKGLEGLHLQLAAAEKPADQTEGEFEEAKAAALEGAVLSAMVFGQDGEQVYVRSANDLETQRLPRRITSITYDSASNLRTIHNWQPDNRFNVTLDFTEPPGFDRYDPTSAPTPNASQVEVNGSNSTWVAGVNEAIISFLKERGRNRGWLHDHAIYNLYNWFLALPASLWMVFRFEEIVGPRIAGAHGALKGALYVYLFLMAYLFARGVVYSLRWMFPLIEFKGSRSNKARAVVGGTVGSLVFALLYDVLRALFWGGT